MNSCNLKGIVKSYGLRAPDTPGTGTVSPCLLHQAPSHPGGGSTRSWQALLRIHMNQDELPRVLRILKNS